MEYMGACVCELNVLEIGELCEYARAQRWHLFLRNRRMVVLLLIRRAVGPTGRRAARLVDGLLGSLAGFRCFCAI